MEGNRISKFFEAEAEALMALYRNIETLLPAEHNMGAAHVPEEGRYIEALLRDFLNKHLPENLRAYTGFILRTASKVGDNDRTRRITEVDAHSKQLDIIIYDRQNYPVFESFGEFAIVPPEGVVGIVSVKKHLYADGLVDEIRALKHAAALCSVMYRDGESKRVRRGPNTCMLAFSDKIERIEIKGVTKHVFNKISEVSTDASFDECIGQLIVLDSFSVFKERPNSEHKFDNKAKYVAFEHKEKERHLGLQFLLTGILSAYYHKSRKLELRPGLTDFSTERKFDYTLGEIQVDRLR